MDIYPLLGHGYLASYLNGHGRSVEIFDATFERGSGSYHDALEFAKPAIVGVYGHLLSRQNAFAFAREACQRGLPAVAGGPDATGYYEEYVHNGFDVVVRSEGEETARELMEWAAAGGEPSELEHVLEVAYVTESGSVAVCCQSAKVGQIGTREINVMKSREQAP